jgi:S1-C subfamily serine protease
MQESQSSPAPISLHDCNIDGNFGYENINVGMQCTQHNEAAFVLPGCYNVNGLSFAIPVALLVNR